MRPSDKTLRRLGVSFIATEAGISEYRLNSNSLKIVLCPDPLAQATAIVQHVHVGSRHEGGGNTGHSHLLEHLLFKGTPRFNKTKGNSYDQFMKRMGNICNATTWYDRTNYYGLVPPFAVADYLMYEADRLRNAYITDEDLRTEMPVVVDEFDRSDNSEDALLDRQLMATAFTEHQYRMDTIGNRAEVMKVTAAALRERLYDVYYYPNNCTVIIAGCFAVEQVLTDIVRLYGGIPASPRPIWVPEAVEPEQFGERRFVINRPGDLPRILMGYHVPEADHEDTEPLAALGLILAGDNNESSRLFRKLVDRGLVSEVSCGSHPMHDPGILKVSAKLTPGTKLQAVEKVILKEIERLTDTNVSAKELARAKAFNRNGTALVRADRLEYALAISEHEAAADWRWGAGWDTRFDAVTAADIQRVAQRYLSADNRTVGHFVPTKAPTRTAPAATTGDTLTTTDGTCANDKTATTDNTTCGKDGTAGSTPESQSTSSCGGDGENGISTRVRQVVLSNGMTILLMPQPAENSAIGVSMRLRAGNHNSPEGKVPVCDLVAEMLSEGSQNYSKDRIAELVTEMRVEFGFYTDAFTTQHSTLVPERELTRYIDLLADVLQNPLLAEKEFEVLRGLQQARYEADDNEPSDRAYDALSQAVYPQGNPHRHTSAAEQLRQLAGVNVEDLRSFHKTHYTPKGVILSLVGNFDVDAILKLLESKFGAWSGSAPAAPVSMARPVTQASRVNVNIDGKDNLTINVAVPSELAMTSDDYLAATLANNVLGGDTLNGRLGMEIREKRGLTYGIVSRFLDPVNGGGLWRVEMTTNPRKVEEAIPLIKQVVEQFIAEGPTAEELQAEKESLIVASTLSKDKPLDMAVILARYKQAGLDLTMLDTFSSRVAAVTKADVDAAIRKHFRIGEAITVVAGQLPASV